MSWREAQGSMDRPTMTFGSQPLDGIDQVEPRQFMLMLPRCHSDEVRFDEGTPLFEAGVLVN
jgi:hypothetical protein